MGWHRYTISLFYFALGFIFLFPSVSIWVFLKEKTRLDPGKLPLAMQLTDAPWLFKPLYAWISDRYPLAGYRRKSYVILFSFGCAMCWMLLSSSMAHLAWFFVVLFAENLFLCVADVVVDALVIERVKEEEDGEETQVKAASRLFKRCITILTGYIAICMLD